MMALGRCSLLTVAWLAGCGSGASLGPRRSALDQDARPPDGPRPTATVPAPAAPTGASSAPRPTPTLERVHTGQAAPTIVVNNAYPRPQHLFIDWRLVGRVAPGTTSTFELTAGVHTVTSADSADPNDHPRSLTEIFEAGYGYRYQIVAK